MAADAPGLTREESFAVIADWLRELPAEDRAALFRLLVNDGSNRDADPILMEVGRALAPVLLRMDLGDDPGPLLAEALQNYRGNMTELGLRQMLAALLVKATVWRDVAGELRRIEGDSEFSACADFLREWAAHSAPVEQRGTLELVALVVDEMTHGVDPLDAFETLTDGRES